MSDRIDRTTVGTYDQVVALTQYIINAGIDSRWTAVTNEREDPFKFSIKRRDTSSMDDVELGSPRIIVATDTGNVSLVYYRIHIKSGKVNLFLSEDTTNNSMIKYTMNDWYFSFPVNIGLSGVAEGSEKYKEIMKRMNKPGDYTIQQLLVDMSTAQYGIPNEKDSSFGVWVASDRNVDASGKEAFPPGAVVGQPRDWFHMPDIVQRQFQRFLEDITQKLLDFGLQDLGYTATAKSVDNTYHEPTFLPNNVRFQTYPWVDPAQRDSFKPTAGLSGTSRFNYLLYLETTGTNSLPSATSPNAFLSVANGNWTDGTDPSKDAPSKFGSMVISSRNFLDIYFIPKLKKFNRLLWPEFTDLRVWISQTASIFAWASRFGVTMHIGSGSSNISVRDPEDDKYQFQRDPSNPSAKWNVFKDPIPKNALEWTFTKTGVQLEKSDDSGTPGSKSYMDGWANTSIWARLWIVPGENTITLDGRSQIWAKSEVNPSRLDPNVVKEINAITTWQVKFILQEVSDGGLSIGIQRTGPNTEYTTNDDMDWLKNFIEGCMTTARQNMDNLVQTFKNALEGQEKFYFPSKGTFFIKNPLFNHEGDLICDLEYNGDSYATNPNPTAEPRPQPENIKFADMPTLDKTVEHHG